MISGPARTLVLYLASLSVLTAIILSFFAFLAPTFLFHQVAFLTVVPSTALVSQSDPTQSLDGPSIFLGLLGSCAKQSNSASVNCTAPSISPHYDLSVLPGNAPDVFSAPNITIFIAIAISFSSIFFLFFTLISLRHKIGSMGGLLEKPMLQSLTAWSGCIGFLLGLTSFLGVRLWFGKAVDDFNRGIQFENQQGPKLMAATGNGFIMVWVAYALYVVPIIVSLTKFNVKATKQ